MNAGEYVIQTNVDNPFNSDSHRSGLLRGHTTTPRSTERDSIIANSDQFNTERMKDYKRIVQYAEDNDCTFEKALEVVG